MINTKKYPSETRNAYFFAYAYGLTDEKDINKAQLFSTMTRAQFSKMISEYATVVLGKKPELTKDCSAFGASIANYQGSELHHAMVKSCQLNLMGIHPRDGAINNFHPNKIISRAEVATVLARLYWGTTYEGTRADRSTKPLQALKNHNILSNTNPSIQELRGEVFKHMYRAHLQGLDKQTATKTIQMQNISEVSLDQMDLHLNAVEKSIPTSLLNARVSQLSYVIANLLSQSNYQQTPYTEKMIKHILQAAAKNTEKPLISASAKIILSKRKQ